MVLSYCGKEYVGWQIQPNGMAVQEVIQNGISTILRQDINIVGAGRTDTGVHACKMFAHFDVQTPLEDCNELTRRLNNFLPKSISIHEIREVVKDAHTRFSALSRTYKYYITTKKDPFLHDYKHRIFFSPDLKSMNEMCEVFKEYTDFTSFSKLHSAAKTNICHIYEAYWEQDGDDYVFTIRADRFLRNMVRAIVGTMIRVGKGVLDEEGLRQIFDAKDRHAAGESAPAHGLFLHDVEYSPDIWK